jgi:hypothetical protein
MDKRVQLKQDEKRLQSAPSLNAGSPALSIAQSDTKDKP